MKTFIIEHIYGSKVPFKVQARNEEEALNKVHEHMGITCYHVVGLEEN